MKSIAFGQHRPEMNNDLLLKRYCQGGETTWGEVCRRVARHASPESEFLYNNLFGVINECKFMPSRMTYMGTDYPFASSCFVFDIDDSLESILTILKEACHVQKYGGGTGYDFSKLRPKGDLINTSGGEASGPISFMKLYHNAMEVVNRAGKKHAAQMGVLRCDHPDVFEFIHCKDAEGALWTFNISVAVTDAFMKAVEQDQWWELVFDGKVYKTVEARELWAEITQHAWHNGDPGVIFIDTVNRYNRYPFPVNATNPCGEIPQPSHFACNLGSIDLSRHVVDGGFDYFLLDHTVRQAVRFLDGSIENAFFPVEKIQQNTREYRNIGIGVMGWADALIMMGISYDSVKAVKCAEEVMSFIHNVAEDESKKLGRGARKNITLTAIAPTGSISMLAGCSSGIEPLFGIVTTKNTYVGTYYDTHWLFSAIAKEYGFYSEALLEEVARTGSVQHIAEVPDEIKALFKTTLEISYDWHVQHQAAFQQYTEQSVSKTINLPNSATVDDVGDAYKMAYYTGCKSVTVYRDGSRQVQVLENKTKDKANEVCPKCKAILFMDDGKKKCVSCGYVPTDTNKVTEEKPVAKPTKAVRPQVLTGLTYKKDTPIGTAYVTVNGDETGNPFEVFLNVGKAGSEVAAVSEGLGRLISLILRLPSPLGQAERVVQIVDELAGIGGGRHVGFGRKRVRSLPDGIAQVLAEHINGEADVVEDKTPPTLFVTGEICPECHEATLLYLEGCNKCSNCGYSEC